MDRRMRPAAARLLPLVWRSNTGPVGESHRHIRGERRMRQYFTSLRPGHFIPKEPVLIGEIGGIKFYCDELVPEGTARLLVDGKIQATITGLSEGSAKDA